MARHARSILAQAFSAAQPSCRCTKLSPIQVDTAQPTCPDSAAEPGCHLRRTPLCFPSSATHILLSAASCSSEPLSCSSGPSAAAAQRYSNALRLLQLRSLILLLGHLCLHHGAHNPIWLCQCDQLNCRHAPTALAILGAAVDRASGLVVHGLHPQEVSVRAETHFPIVTNVEETRAVGLAQYLQLPAVGRDGIKVIAAELSFRCQAQISVLARHRAVPAAPWCWTGWCRR